MKELFLKNMKDLFLKDSKYSWRKILAFQGGFLFSFSVIGFEFGLPELPVAYIAVLASVFAFYFAKDTIDNIKQKKNENSN